MSPLGVEYGTKYVLVGPDGTRVVFNDASDPDFVGALSPESSGLDSPEVREDAQDATEADGGVHGNFFYGRRPVILQGTIIASSAANRNMKVSKLLRASNAMRGDAKLSWKPLGASDEVFLNLRRQQPVRLSKGFVKDFFVPLVSASAEIFSSTLKTASALGQTSGPTLPKNPGGHGQIGEASGPGGVWTNLVNLLLADSIFAKVTDSEGATSKTAVASVYGFSIPTNATILGVEVTIVKKGVNTRDENVVLIKEKSLEISSNKASAAQWPAGLQEAKVYGGPTDMWGLTSANLTPAIVNSPDFGVGLSVRRFTTGSYTAEVDWIGVKIYYKNPPIVVSVINEGDAPSPLTIRLTGPATNVVLKNATTGKSIKIDAAISAGTVLEVDFANRTIRTSTGTNLYSKLDAASSKWWDLIPGENKIEVTVESAETTSTKVELRFRDAWV